MENDQNQESQIIFFDENNKQAKEPWNFNFFKKNNIFTLLECVFVVGFFVPWIAAISVGIPLADRIGYENWIVAFVISIAKIIAIYFFGTFYMKKFFVKKIVANSRKFIINATVIFAVFLLFQKIFNTFQSGAFDSMSLVYVILIPILVIVFNLMLKNNEAYIKEEVQSLNEYFATEPSIIYKKEIKTISKKWKALFLLFSIICGLALWAAALNYFSLDFEYMGGGVEVYDFRMLVTLPYIFIIYLLALLKLEVLGYMFVMRAEYSGPGLAFLFWTIIFYKFLTFISARVDNICKYFLYLLPIVIIFLAYIPHPKQIHDANGKNDFISSKMQACLSGNIKVDSRRICFEGILEGYIKNEKNVTIYDVMDKCSKLPNTPVLYTELDFQFMDNPVGIKYPNQQLFCLGEAFETLVSYSLSDSETEDRDERSKNYFKELYKIYKTFTTDNFRLPKNTYLDFHNSDLKTVTKFLRSRYCKEINDRIGSYANEYCLKNFKYRYTYDWPSDDLNESKIVSLSEYPNVVKGEPFWIKIPVNFESEKNTLLFDAKFQGENLESLGRMVVILDGVDLGTIEEKDSPPGMDKYKMTFDKKQSGEHLLEFKIISLTPNQQSFAKIENIEFPKIN
jgi:hypothetical protein